MGGGGAPMLTQLQPQQLYTCKYCNVPYDKKQYNDHMVCNKKCEELIRRAYDDARVENVTLREKFKEIGEYMNDQCAEKDKVIEGWKIRFQNAQQEILNSKKQLEIRDQEMAVILNRQNERIVENANLQREIERLRSDHYDEMLKLQNKQTIEANRILTDCTQRLEKQKSEHEAKRTEWQTELQTTREQWDARLRKDRSDAETYWTERINQVTHRMDQERLDLETSLRKSIKQKEDELVQCESRLSSLQQQVTSCRKKIEDQTEKNHVLELSLLEVKQDHSNECDAIKGTYLKQIDDLQSKLRSMQIQAGILQDTIQTEQKRRQEEQKEWNSERDLLQQHIRQCKSRHIGQDRLYSELVEKIESLFTGFVHTARLDPARPLELEPPDQS